MNNSKKRWSEDDEIYLEYYLYDDTEKEESYKAAAEFLGRSERAIKKKIWRMRKLNGSIGHINKPYSEKEITFIKEHYLTMKAKNIGVRLNRSPTSIINKAYELGIRKNKTMRDYEKRIRELITKGYNTYEISKELKISRPSINYFREKNNI